MQLKPLARTGRYQTVQAAWQVIGGIVPGQDQDEQPVVAEPAECERQRLQRDDVRPLGIVDRERNWTLLLQVAERFEDIGSDREDIPGPSVGAGGGQRPAARQLDALEQLLDDTEGKPGLELLAGSAEDVRAIHLVQELAQEDGLADAWRSLHQHDAGVPAADLLQPLP
jgi:hypothetical protein